MPALVPPEPPLHVVLVAPAIPPNTGNAARTCVVTGSRLHLVGPIRFSLDQKTLRRAGLDYWPSLAPDVYAGWPEFAARALGGRADRLHLFSSHAARSVFDAEFRPGDFLVFGSERDGLPPALLAAHPDRCVGIPLLPGQRSLNLATAVGIGVYQALRVAAPSSRGAGGARTVDSS